MHVDVIDLIIIIGFIIKDTANCVAAGGVDCRDIATVFQLNAAAWLVDAAEDVKELMNTFCLGFTGDGIHFDKSSTNESGCRGEITRQSDSAHSTAVYIRFKSP